MTTALLVVAGAVVGAPLRYLVDRAIQRRHDSLFPWGTFTDFVLATRRGEPGPQYAIAVSLPLGPSRFTAETRHFLAEILSSPFSVTSGPGAGRMVARKPPNTTEVFGGQTAVALACAPFATLVDADTVRSSSRRPQ